MMENNRQDLHPMGATPLEEGVLFRVWAPNAAGVAVVGSFNDWNGESHPMHAEPDGNWVIAVRAATVGAEYKFQITTDQGSFLRIDPYARELTSSVGNAVVHDPGYDWQDSNFFAAEPGELVIYELHVGTFSCDPGDADAGQFAAVAKRLPYLKSLGINAIQLMPVAEFAGERSWGYNPAHPFSVERSYGGSLEFKRLVSHAHDLGIAVLLDVVYNHLGPSDLDLWQFDGWSENGLGGIYFYNDFRAMTPWGQTRPDYGREEVRRYIGDNVLMWFRDYHVDGLRFDCTQYIRTLRGTEDADLPNGWSLLQDIHRDISTFFPGRLTIAEDLQNNSSLVLGVSAGGAGFDAQWDGNFVHPVRRAAIGQWDDQRCLSDVAAAVGFSYNDNPFSRVIYSESHDEVANGSARVPQEIDPENPGSWRAQKRSTLAAALVLTAPGIPMLFQGQELLLAGWFDDSAPVDWSQSDSAAGITSLYRDLILLRRGFGGLTRGLGGQHTHVHHCNEGGKVLAFHRWADGGPGDDVVVVANFSCEELTNYGVGFPAEGPWQVRWNSDDSAYNADFSNRGSQGAVAYPGPCDAMPCRGEVSVAPYSVLVLSQG